MTEMPLSRPINAHGELLSKLTFREPNGEDITECGLPVVVSGKEQRVDTKVVAALIALLAGIPPSSVKLLSAPDYLAATAVVTGFFKVAIPA